MAINIVCMWLSLISSASEARVNELLQHASVAQLSRKFSWTLNIFHLSETRQCSRRAKARPRFVGRHIASAAAAPKLILKNWLLARLPRTQIRLLMSSTL